MCVESCPTTTDFTKYYCIGGVTPTALTLAALVQNGYCLFQFETEEVGAAAVRQGVVVADALCPPT